MSQLHSQWECPICHANFYGSRSRNWHERNLMKSATDPSRCDKILQRDQSRVPLIPTDSLQPHDDPGDLAQEPPVEPFPASPSSSSDTDRSVVIRPPEYPPTVIDPRLSRRPPAKQANGLYEEIMVQLGVRPEPLQHLGPRNMTVVQHNWKWYAT